jgi:hypothetical protein
MSITVTIEIETGSGTSITIVESSNFASSGIRKLALAAAVRAENAMTARP